MKLPRRPANWLRARRRAHEEHEAEHLRIMAKVDMPPRYGRTVRIPPRQVAGRMAAASSRLPCGRRAEGYDTDASCGAALPGLNTTSRCPSRSRSRCTGSRPRARTSQGRGLPVTTSTSS